MRIQLSQSLLAEGLQAVMRTVPAASPIPILTGLLIEAHPAGITLTAANSMTMAQYELPQQPGQVIVEQTGAAVAPASYLYELVRKLDDGLIDLERTESFQLIVGSPVTRCRLWGMDAELFPPVPGIGREAAALRIPNGMLRRMIRQVAFAVSSSDSRPILTGVLCQLVGSRLFFTATDGVRLATSSGEVERPQPSTDPETASSVIIPGKTLADWARLLSVAEGWTDIKIGPRHAGFQTDRASLYSVVLDGTYPSVDRLVPGDVLSEWTMEAPSLLQAVERVALLAGKESLVHFHSTAPGEIELTAQSAEIGELREVVRPDTMEGESFFVSVNGRYLADILRAAGSVHISVQMAGNRSPLVIRPMDEPGSLYLLTPVRTHVTV